MPVTHFITAPTFHRKRLFQNELYGDLLTEVLMQWRQQCSVALHDYVVMPDHLHLLFSVPEDRADAGAFTQLQQTFAKELQSQFGYDGEVWDAKIRERTVGSPADAAECAKMIHSNPVRVGFCDTATEYRMSSKASHWVLDPLPEALRETAMKCG